MGMIYISHTNTVNGKSYIGQTVYDAIEFRIVHHLKGKGNKPIKNAVKKYGEDVFTYEILQDGVIPEFLDVYEIQAIKNHNTIAPHGYTHLTYGGEGGILLIETRKKIG